MLLCLTGITYVVRTSRAGGLMRLINKGFRDPPCLVHKIILLNVVPGHSYDAGVMVQKSSALSN